VCNGSIEVEDTSEINEENAPVPTTDGFGLVFLTSSIMTYDFFLSLKYSNILLIPHSQDQTRAGLLDITDYHTVPILT
jgi:hypothetical protein